jgi:hypothetical protein
MPRSSDDIVSYARESFGFLTDLGFVESQPRRLNWERKLTWLHQDVGIEIEIDCREYMLYLLIVRLEDGRLPAGYYESHGRRCRIHLEKAITERQWKADDAAIRKLYSSVEPRDAGTGYALLESLIEEYSRLLRPLIPRILSEWSLLF